MALRPPPIPAHVALRAAFISLCIGQGLAVRDLNWTIAGGKGKTAGKLLHPYFV